MRTDGPASTKSFDDWFKEGLFGPQAEPSHAGRYLHVLRARWRLIFICTLLVFAMVAGLTVLRTPIYEATATIVRQSGQLGPSLLDVPGFLDTDAERDLATMTEMVGSLRVAAEVKNQLELPDSASALLEQVSAEAAADANVINVTARSTSPEEAAQLANAFAEQAIRLRQENIQQVLQEARTALENQLANLPAESRGSEGPRLQELLGNLAIVQQTQRGGYELWQPAQAAPNPISPRPTRDLAAGLAVGLIVGICLALVVDRFDNRLKEPEDFEREYDLPVLAKVPRLGGRGAGRRHQDDGVVGFQRYGAQLLEPYRTLRSSLQFLQAQRGFKTILITSGYPGEGKSAAACNLALALTLSGFRVVLVDADLRNPRIHDYLHLENREGLSNLLAGTAELTATMQRVQVDDYLPRSNGGRPSEGGILPGKLLCITSGTLPPNPAELLGSAQMYSLLSELQNRGDYVILDSPPLLPVADAVALASHLDAVILVGRAGRSSTDEAREVRTILSRVEARPLGVIMIGPPTTARYYGYEQAPELPT